MNPSILRVTCALIFRDNTLLAAQRNEHTSLPLKWELPGGKIEPGETEEDCLHRELKEELNTRVAIEQKLVPHQHHYSPLLTIELVPFVCRPLEPIHRLEHRELRWLAFFQIFGLDWAPADRVILQHYFRQIQQGQQ